MSINTIVVIEVFVTDSTELNALYKATSLLVKSLKNKIFLN